MNEKYYRITAYHKQEDFTCILDSNGMFEKLWQFSSFLVSKNINIIEVSKLENVIDINIEPAEIDNENIILRACADEKPEYIEQEYNGILYKAIRVADKVYIPNKEIK